MSLSWMFISPLFNQLAQFGGVASQQQIGNSTRLFKARLDKQLLKIVGIGNYQFLKCISNT